VNFFALLKVTASRAPAQPGEGIVNKFMRDNRGFLIFLLFFGLFRTAIADWNPVPSGSMRPTIQEGDVVFVNRMAYDLKVPLTNRIVAHTGQPVRGDIVTFYSPIDETRLIKRLVALPGDTVEMRDKVVIVNGQPATYKDLGTARERMSDGVEIDALRLDESSNGNDHLVQWLHPPGASDYDSFGPIVVPPDHFLMLGDNRDNSADSRYFGLVPRNLLIGRAVRVLVSADINNNWALKTERWGERLN
jgi:signal peptidase I